MEITAIAAGFAEGVKYESLILPDTIKTIEINAFKRCVFNEIYFFDNIEERFGSGIKTVHINASVAPRYTTDCDNAQFAEDMDRLILNEDKRKMVFYGGRSMLYGLKSELVENAFNDKYVVCNIGVIGETNAVFQFECIRRCLGQGDVFVHAPEEMSRYQFLNDVSAEPRIFMCTESNYDLFALCDFSVCPTMAP